jgi:hypothetical protein
MQAKEARSFSRKHGVFDTVRLLDRCGNPRELM